MEEKSNFTLLAIVAIVAIVGLVVMFKGSSGYGMPMIKAGMSSGMDDDSSNNAGMATKRSGASQVDCSNPADSDCSRWTVTFGGGSQLTCTKAYSQGAYKTTCVPKKQ